MTRHLCLALLLCCCLSLAAGPAAADECAQAYAGVETLKDIEALHARLAQYPQCKDLYIVLGDVSYEQQLWLDAEGWYAKALEVYPDDSYLMDRHAECLRNKPIALDNAAGLDVEGEIQKRGLGGTKGLPPLSLEINFDSGSAALKPEAHSSLDAFATMLQERFGDYRFEVQGHTDAVGSEQSNQALSKRRAEAVQSYLVQRHGIDPARLTVQGYGQSRPLASNTTPEGQARNRRVQFQGFK